MMSHMKKEKNNKLFSTKFLFHSVTAKKALLETGNLLESKEDKNPPKRCPYILSNVMEDHSFFTNLVFVFNVIKCFYCGINGSILSIGI